MRQPHIPPNSNFSSDFGHFISKILENIKIVCNKKVSKFVIFERDVNPEIRIGETRPPSSLFPAAASICIGHRNPTDLHLYVKH